VAQECLHNVAKHSGAQEATLDAAEENKKGLLLSVIDERRGFDPTAADGERVGIVGIRERVRGGGGKRFHRFTRVDGPGSRMCGSRLNRRLPDAGGRGLLAGRPVLVIAGLRQGFVGPECEIVGAVEDGGGY